jgi:hypothetical protein
MTPGRTELGIPQRVFEDVRHARHRPPDHLATAGAEMGGDATAVQQACPGVGFGVERATQLLEAIDCGLRVGARELADRPSLLRQSLLQPVVDREQVVDQRVPVELHALHEVQRDAIIHVPGEHLGEGLLEQLGLTGLHDALDRVIDDGEPERAEDVRAMVAVGVRLRAADLGPERHRVDGLPSRVGLHREDVQEEPVGDGLVDLILALRT